MTDKEKLEKVIKGLECCAIDGGCGACPYDSTKDCQGSHPTPETLMKDALALLRHEVSAQEPRVMTLEEVLAAEVVYAEDVDKAEIIPVLVDRRAHDRVVLVMARLRGGPSITIYPLIGEYGKRWRCWTSRPTDEQREVTLWHST